MPFKVIGAAIADVAAKHKLALVKDFIGHGVGRVFHAAPYVLHYRNNEPGVMQVGVGVGVHVCGWVRVCLGACALVVGCVFLGAAHTTQLGATTPTPQRPTSTQVNQTFTIEPIFAEGGGKVITWPDDWTAVMADGGLAAQWEHTVLITPQGHDILTVLPE